MWGGGQFSNVFYQRSIYYEEPGTVDGPRRLAEMQAPLELSVQGVELSEPTGTIVVQKNSVPDDPRDFSFTAGGGLSPASFQLDDDSDPTLSNTQTFQDVPAGSGYSISEAPNSDWSLTSATCDDGSPVSNVSVNSGETVTCTFTNTTRNYPRPATATPLRVPLVPAYSACTAPNTTHVAPLALPSCTPPAQESALLTTSTIGRGSGFARLSVAVGDENTPADEADIGFSATVTDVRDAGTGFDYTGKVVLSSAIRITDRTNGNDQMTAATVQDTTLGVPFDCVATSSNLVGSICSLSTTADTLVPGFAKEGSRAVISAFSVELLDAGADGDVTPAGCPFQCGTGDEQPFLRQGVVTP